MRLMDMFRSAEGRRDKIAEEIGLFSRELNERINNEADRYEAEYGKTPLAALAAISIVENQLMSEHYGGGSVSAQYVKWHAIMEVMYTKRLVVIRHDPSVLLPSELLEKISRFIRDRFYELQEGVPTPTTMLTSFQLVDQAMLECLGKGNLSNQDMFGLWAREVCRLGYEAKVAVLNHKM